MSIKVRTFNLDKRYNMYSRGFRHGIEIGLSDDVEYTNQLVSTQYDYSKKIEVMLDERFNGDMFNYYARILHPSKRAVLNFDRNHKDTQIARYYVFQADHTKSKIFFIFKHEGDFMMSLMML